MTNDTAKLVQPIVGLDWYMARRDSIKSACNQLDELRDKLTQLGLWRGQDEQQRTKLLAEVNDYLQAISANPNRAYKAHSLTCMEGPNYLLPIGPASWTVTSYVWRVDDHIQLLTELARNRYTLTRMRQNPEAPPIDKLSYREQVARALRSAKELIYEQFENRPEHQAKLQGLIDVQQPAADEELGKAEPIARRYALEGRILDVTGAVALRWKRMSMTMTAEELILAAQVASDLPDFPPKLVSPKSKFSLEELEFASFEEQELEEFKVVWAANREIMDKYSSQYEAAWRNLTQTEVDELTG